MTDEELITALRMWSKSELCREAADRIEALVKERDQWIEHTKNAVWSDSEELRLAKARAERLEAAADYILDGMGIHAPDYQIDPDDDLLDAANSDWVRDVLTRLAAALQDADEVEAYAWQLEQQLGRQRRWNGAKSCCACGVTTKWPQSPAPPSQN